MDELKANFKGRVELDCRYFHVFGNVANKMDATGKERGATGAVHAALAEDLEPARTQSVAASPTLLFNEGRQRLTSNVGYRIIEANILELLEGAPGQLSWC
jgi:hypothetical protein